MMFLEWLVSRVPGATQWQDSLLEVSHNSGDKSFLWRREGNTPLPAEIGGVGLYAEFDGMSLFSGTFKVASSRVPRALRGVNVVPSLAEMNAYAREDGAEFPDGVIPFMMQAGRGFYGVEPEGGTIFLWDTETDELRTIGLRLDDVFEAWLQDMVDDE